MHKEMTLTMVTGMTATMGFRRGMNRAWEMATTPVEEVRLTRHSADTMMSRTVRTVQRQISEAERIGSSTVPASPRSQGSSRASR